MKIMVRIFLMSLFALLLNGLSNIAYANVKSSDVIFPTFANMLETTMPSVVNISTKSSQKVSQPIINDPISKHAFSGKLPKEFNSKATGSGVIIDAVEGYIVTNNHVISNAKKIIVTLSDGRQSRATVVGTDPRTDIAVIKIPEKNLKSLKMADLKTLRVGDFAIAIGNPYGLGQSVSLGIISALGRSNLGIEDYEDFIQTDASINPGNSGGALVNYKGELLGINSAIFGGKDGASVGISFAIPVNMVQAISKQLIQYKKVQRGELGIIVQNMDKKLTQALGLKDLHGVVIADVMEGSSADIAGLKVGDFITHVNGNTVKNAHDVRNTVAGIRVGSSLLIKIQRNGEASEVKVNIGKIETSK